MRDESSLAGDPRADPGGRGTCAAVGCPGRSGAQWRARGRSPKRRLQGKPQPFPVAPTLSGQRHNGVPNKSERKGEHRLTHKPRDRPRPRPATRGRGRGSRRKRTPQCPPPRIRTPRSGRIAGAASARGKCPTTRKQRLPLALREARSLKSGRSRPAPQRARGRGRKPEERSHRMRCCHGLVEMQVVPAGQSLRL